jgi:rare lipoprotein A
MPTAHRQPSSRGPRSSHALWWPIHPGMNTPRSALAGLLLLATTACGNAVGAPVQTVAVAAHAPESVRILDRLAEQTAAAVPDVTGLTATQARVRLRSAGLEPQVLALQRKAKRVHAQWPAAGEPQPADGAVVVWLGTPPTPPPPPPPPPAPQESQSLPELAASADGGAPATDADPQLITPDPATQPGGRTPGLEGFVPPPHPPRANIRTLDPAEPGTVLQGRASWYGPGFAGHTTACGGVFDPGQLTLATRELRCGTRVLVTGPGGRAVEATVTDWGPAEWTNRRFDLSQATMAAVAGLGAGVVDVTVEVR